MKSMILILIGFFLTGCATGHDAWIRKEKEVYYSKCKEWEETKAKKLVERKPGEEEMMLQDVMVRRCEEDPSVCSPPQKHEALKNLEYMWGAPETPDFCLEAKN